MIPRRLLPFLATPALAQGYPVRPVRLVVPFPPGGSLDVVARMLAEETTRRWPHPMVVENRTGAAGNIGAELVARAAPDGHTLIIVSNNMITMNPHVARMAIDPLTDLVPVSMLAQSPLVLVGALDRPVRNLAELLAAARARPGALTYASIGNGTPHHVAMAMLCRRAGIEMTHVPYRGTPEALADVAGGRVDAMVSPFGPAQPLIQGSRIRALAATGAARLPWMPELPTVAEAGIEGFDAGSWLAMAAPRGTPAGIIATLATFSAEVLNDPRIKPMQDRQAVVADTMPPEATLALWQREHAAWGEVIRAARITAE